ncbi:toprim domain-containing protein, partial [Erwinia amylovora]|uniref:toprim domain-containing protein n=1 Tax=Erwinia amylovora TaxID=552 RepID=UPI001443B084
MSFWVAGWRNVTAAYGVNGFTDDHRRAFAQHGTKQVLIAFDNDAAGNEAAVRLAAELVQMQIDTFRIVFPQGMDANGWLCRVAEPERAFGLLVESAQPMRDAVTVKTPVAEPETLPSLAASPSDPGVVVERGEAGEVLIGLGAQRWRVRGLGQVKPGAAVMKLSLQVLDRESGAAFADSL